MPKRHSFGTAIRGTALCGAALIAIAGMPAAAQTSEGADLQRLMAEVEALKAAQRDSADRIAELEAALQARSVAAPRAGAAAVVQETVAAPATNMAQAPADMAKPRLDISGDVRVRYEENFGDSDRRNRGRGVARARLRASYEVNDWLSVGGQVITGDPDDPNTADVSLSNFDDDLQVSLDQAYARVTFGDLVLHGGKIPQPFMRTDLVWDSDVSPQGISASYKAALGEAVSAKLTGLLFPIDESVAGPNSDMIGGQLALAAAPAAHWQVELAAGYYDYSLRSLGGADAGDIRSNVIGPNGRYLSDFDLLNGLAAITYGGLGEPWPVRLVADYVKNLGARVDEDSGFGVDLLVGRTSQKGDLRFGYGYAETGVDAVLAAFSHDNTDLPTNYRQHMLSIDYVPAADLILTATYYRFRPKDPLYAGGNEPGDWLNRLRLNFLVNF